MKCELKNICQYRVGKVLVNTLDNKNYVSTENMLPDKRGIQPATSMPNIAVTQRYCVGDVLVSNIRPYFKKIYFAKNDGGCSNDVLVFQPLNNVEPQYLYYVLANDEFFAYCTASSKGTKMPRGDKGAIMQYKVNLPDLKTQKKIAKVLSALDDKIELNNQINKNLEEQIKSIFESWFVTFNHFGGSKPSEMQHVPLEQLCEVVTKGTTPTTMGKAFVSHGVNFIKAETITDSHTIDFERLTHIDNETDSMLKRSRIKKGDILFTIAGTLGRFALVDSDVLPANTNQAVAIIRPNQNKVSSEYLYSFLIANWHNDYYSKRIQQAVQANLSLTTIKSLPIAILSRELAQQYDKLIRKLISLIKANEQENRKLFQFRDTLLPKLMSGEIDVDNVEI